MKNPKTFYVKTINDFGNSVTGPRYIRKEVFEAAGLVPLIVQAAHLVRDMKENGHTIDKCWFNNKEQFSACQIESAAETLIDEKMRVFN